MPAAPCRERAPRWRRLISILMANWTCTKAALSFSGTVMEHSCFTRSIALPAMATSGTDGGAAAADLNGDGKPDLVIADGNGVAVLLGNGDGNFQTPLDYSTTTAADVLVADLNGDGRLDLAVAESGCQPYSCLTLGLGQPFSVAWRRRRHFRWRNKLRLYRQLSRDASGFGRFQRRRQTRCCSRD